MLEHVLPADIHDEREFRLQSDDVRKILLRPNAQIHAAGLNCFPQSGNHILGSGFVGQKVVGTEIAAGFGEVRDHPPKFFVG